MATCLGIEIGGTKLQLVAGTSAGDIKARWRFQVERTSGGAGIRNQIERVLPEILAAHEINAIGVGYGGPVDWKTGQICCSHQIAGWADFPLGQWLRERAAKAIYIDNDANVAALGEAMRGAGQGATPVFYVTLGSGVGGGLVVSGQIYHGARPGESEIGHVRLDRAGTILEKRCSGWAVDKRIRELAADAPESLLGRLARGASGGEARFLAQAVAGNDTAAHALLESVAEDLAFGLSHVTHLVHPEVIVLGGGLSFVGEPLRAAVERHLGRFIMDAFAPGPRVRLASLAEDAVPVGALLLAGTVATRT